MVAVLQTSWLAASLSNDTLSPDQVPVALPAARTWVAGVPVPVIAYHAGRQPVTLVAVTVALTAPTVTGPLLGLLKFPDKACAGPPGYRPVTVFVWLTTTATVVPAVA